jgi:hypothetical protein
MRFKTMKINDLITELLLEFWALLLHGWVKNL